MKFRQLIVIFAIGGGCCLSTAQPISVPALGSRFKQTRERIDAIFKHRTGQDSLPDPKLNLFRTASAPATTTEIPEVRKDPLDSDEVVLQQVVALLRRGTVKKDDQLLLLINQKQYRQGSIVPTRYKDRPVLLQIIEVTTTSVTFGFNTAQLTVPL